MLKSDKFYSWSFIKQKINNIQTNKQQIKATVNTFIIK